MGGAVEACGGLVLGRSKSGTYHEEQARVLVGQRQPRHQCTDVGLRQAARLCAGASSPRDHCDACREEEQRRHQQVVQSKDLGSSAG